MARPKKSALDTQVGGDHYKDMPIQPVEFCFQNDIGFLESQVIKYICRHESENGGEVEDLNKAIHYIELIKEFKYDQ